jgi:hypothetical protein
MAPSTFARTICLSVPLSLCSQSLRLSVSQSLRFSPSRRREHTPASQRRSIRGRKFSIEIRPVRSSSNSPHIVAYSSHSSALKSESSLICQGRISTRFRVSHTRRISDTRLHHPRRHTRTQLYVKRCAHVRTRVRICLLWFRFMYCVHHSFAYLRLANTYLRLEEIVDECRYEEGTECKIAPEPKKEEENVCKWPSAVTGECFDACLTMLPSPHRPGKPASVLFTSTRTPTQRTHYIDVSVCAMYIASVPNCQPS